MKPGRGPGKGMLDLQALQADEDGGVLGWVLLILVLLVLFGVIGFSINA